LILEKDETGRNEKERKKKGEREGVLSEKHQQNYKRHMAGNTFFDTTDREAGEMCNTDTSFLGWLEEDNKTGSLRVVAANCCY